MAAVIGALRVNLGLNSAEFSKGLSNAARSMQAAGKRMQELGGRFSTYITAPVLAAGAAVTAAAHGMARDVMEIDKAAQLAGAGFERFQQLAFAAKSVGIETDKLGDIYKDVNDKLGDFLSTGGGEMADFFENIAPKVGLTAEAFRELTGPEALQAYYNALEQAGLSQAEMTFYLEAIADDASSLIPLLRESGKGFEELGKQAAVLSDTDAEGLRRYNEALRGLDQAVKSLTIALVNSGLIEWVTEAATKITEWITMLSDTNPEIIKWGAIVAGLAATIGPVLLSLGLLAAAIGAISAPVTLTVAGVAALTAGIIAFWPEIEKLGQTLGAFVSGAWAQFEAAWDGMTAKVGEVKAEIAAFAVWIIEEFKALPGRMLEIGGQIIQGLADGINAKWEEVKSGIANIPGNIANSFTSALGIQSPSRVMHEIGVFTMQGLNNGLESMAGQTEDIASSIASTIGQAFRGVIDGSKSVGQAIGDVLGKLGQMFLSQGFQALTGMGGGIGFIGSLLSGLFGFANGGSFQVGGSGGVDSQLVAFKASPNERVTVTKPGQELAGGGHIDVDVRVGVQNGELVPLVTQVSGQVAGQQIKANNRQLPNLMQDIQMRQG